MTKINNIFKNNLKAKRNILLAFSFCFLAFSTKAQVNYVINGGFEQLDSCSVYMQNNTIWNYVPVSLCQQWDTLKNGGGGGLVMHDCFNPNPSSGVPFNLYGAGYQEPRTGDGYAHVAFFKYSANPNVNWRGYTQQKMITKLIAGKSYCVTFWANLVNYSTYAVDELGAFFDDGSIQSIAPIREAPANPQVKSPSGVFYMDTLNWMKVQGSFVANGTEEYITLGNFRLNANTTYTVLDGNTTVGRTLYFIDDVSVIETDLPAYAGSDIWGIPTNTVYLGRTREIGLDDDCFWYKLPNTITAIDTAAGITITVAATTETYMVKQDICGNVKYDTVIVYASGVGINELETIKNNISVFPNPANDVLKYNISSSEIFSKVKIINNLGLLIREEDLKSNSINIKDIPNSVYFLNFYSDKLGTVSKRFVIAR